MRSVHAAARAMLSGIFVVTGARGIVNPDPLIPVARRVTDRAGPALRRIHPNLPSDERTLVQLDAAAKLAGGLLLLTPLRRPAAMMLAASLIPTTLTGHRFWEEEEAHGRAQQEIQFLKNLGIIGGLLLAATDTEGRPGLRWRTSHLMSDANRSLHREARHTRARVRVAARAASIRRRLPG